MSRLRPREVQILGLLAEGLTHAEVGRELHSSESVVKLAARRAYAVLGARNGTHAVAIAYERGILRRGSRVCCRGYLADWLAAQSQVVREGP